MPGLNDGATVPTWQVRSRNGGGTTEANSGTWWSFQTALAPGSFDKLAPLSGATGQMTTGLLLSWGTSNFASSYEYCYDVTNNNSCDGSWISNGNQTFVPINGLNPATTYYWQVRARNIAGTNEANGNEANFFEWFNFQTRP